MTKYVRVKSVPEKLTKEEYVISSPSFEAEIESIIGRAPKNKTTSSNFLRDIAQVVLDKYTNDNGTALTINTTGFRHVPFEGVKDINEVVVKMFEKSKPSIFNDFVDYHIKQRPFGTKLIYFLGDHLLTQAFTQNGIYEIKEKEIDTYMERKKNSSKSTKDNKTT